MKVVFATPSLAGPTAPYIAALEQSVPLITGAGWDEAYVQEVGCPYISAARATMTRRALDAGADVIVYLDYDLSWKPRDLLTLLETPGDVVAGTYRFKKDEEEYMGVFKTLSDGRPIVRQDGNDRGNARSGRLPESHPRSDQPLHASLSRSLLRAALQSVGRSVQPRRPQGRVVGRGLCLLPQLVRGGRRDRARARSRHRRTTDPTAPIPAISTNSCCASRSRRGATMAELFRTRDDLNDEAPPRIGAWPIGTRWR